MSKAQGDGFRTHTNHELNAYRERLRQRIILLEDSKEKWFKVGKGWILTEERNRMVNPRGSWKWEGWEIEAREFWITVFPAESIELKNGKPRVIGIAQAREEFDDDRNAANEYFLKVAKPMAMELENLIED